MSEIIGGDAGRIGFLLKGDYNADSTYDFLDVVYFGNASYVAKKETAGNAPAENNEYWQILARGSVEGDFASKTIYGDESINLGRVTGSTVGSRSSAYGATLQATGKFSHAEGRANSSVNNYAHTEGGGNIAIGLGSHAEGLKTISGNGYILSAKSHDSDLKKIVFDETYEGFSEAFSKVTVGMIIHALNKKYLNDAFVFTVGEVLSSENAVIYANSPTDIIEPGLCVLPVKNTSNATTHSEGRNTLALSDCSHSEGYATTASGKGSHAGGTSSTASGENSFAHGINVTVTKSNSAAFGNDISVSGNSSFACGGRTTVFGDCSLASGYQTNASGPYSYCGGHHTESLKQQHVIGYYNDTTKATASTTVGVSSGTSSHTSFCIGNGTSSTPSNAARIDYNGKLWCKQAYSSTGADYAELFEWADGNPDNEDRRGYFVTVEGKKIKKAQAGDYILGIISGNPSVIGNTDMEWYGQFMRDEFGTFLKENYKETITEPVIDEEGNVTEEEKEVDVEFYKVNPDYDPDAPYTFRLDRPEWDAVGMVGVLPVRDDGTCEVGKFCRCTDGGIATLATDRGFDTYMVIERVTENIVSVILK